MPERIAEGKYQNVQFAKHVLDSIMDLIRFMDAKAGAAVMLATLLVTSGAFFTQLSLPGPSAVHYPRPAQHALMIVAGAIFLWFVVHILQVLAHCQLTLVARPGKLRLAESGKELFFPLRVLQDYRCDKGGACLDADAYMADLAVAGEKEFLRNYAVSILNCASIYNTKQEAVNKALTALKRSLVPWAALAIAKTGSSVANYLSGDTGRAMWPLLLIGGIVLVVVGWFWVYSRQVLGLR